jgi:hypothetical protein
MSPRGVSSRLSKQGCSKWSASTTLSILLLVKGLARSLYHWTEGLSLTRSLVWLKDAVVGMERGLLNQSAVSEISRLVKAT